MINSNHLNLEIVDQGYVNTLEVHPTILDQIKEHQGEDEDTQEIKKNMRRGKAPDFSEDEQGVVWFGSRICVPNHQEVKQLILKEAHGSPCSIHPGSTKMYQDLKEMYWWRSMKREIAEYVAQCDVCQKVKAMHQRPGGLFETLAHTRVEMGRGRDGFHHRPT